MSLRPGFGKHINGVSVGIRNSAPSVIVDVGVDVELGIKRVSVEVYVGVCDSVAGTGVWVSVIVEDGVVVAVKIKVYVGVAEKVKVKVETKVIVIYN